LNVHNTWGDPDAGLSPRSATSYGCDQCHDVVGAATGTTAWPHATRNIDVFEWDATYAGTTPSEKKQTTIPTDMNYWIYTNDIGVLRPVAEDMATDTDGLFGDNASAQPANWNGDFKLLQNSVAGSDNSYLGNTNDGICLKCHVPIDTASKIDRGGLANDPINPTGISSHHHFRIGLSGEVSVTPDNYTEGDRWSASDPIPELEHHQDSRLIFLWR
jgi:hypothetical protein